MTMFNQWTVKGVEYMTKKIISFILVAAMILTIVPLSVFAEINVDDYLEFSGFPKEWTNEHSDFTITAKNGVAAMSVNDVPVDAVGGTNGGGVIAEDGKPYVKYKALSYDEGTKILEIGVFIGNVVSGSGVFTLEFDETNWGIYDLYCGEELTEIDNDWHYINGCFARGYLDTEKTIYKLTDDQAKASRHAVSLLTGEKAAEIDFANGVAYITWMLTESGAKIDATEYEKPVMRFALIKKGNGTADANVITEPAVDELPGKPSVADPTASTQMNADQLYATKYNNLDYIFEALDGTMFGCASSVPSIIKYEGNTASAESFEVDITLNGSAYSKTYPVLVDTVKPTLEVLPEEINVPVQKAVFTVTASDEGGSGVDKITVSVNGGTEQEVLNNKFVATQEGTYVFTAYDKAGNKSAEETRIIENGFIDNQKPQLEVAGVPSGWQNKDVALTVTVNETSKVDVYKDGKLFKEEIGTAFLAEETGKYLFKATDTAGNVGESEEYEILIDKTKPALTLSAPLPTGWSSPFTLSFNYGDEGGSRIQSLTINGEEFDGSYEITANGLYEVILTDGAGNIATQTVEIVWIDEYEPVIDITAVSPSQYVKDFTLTFTATDDETDISAVKVNGETVRAVGGVYSYKIEEDGTYEIEVWDNAGNYATESFVAESLIDNEKPVIIEPSVPEEPCKSYTFEIFAEDLKSGIEKVTVNGSNAIYNADLNCWEFTIKANGKYEFIAYDKVGNKSEAVAVEVANIDNNNPVISFPNFEDVWTNKNVEITISVNKEIESLTVSKDGGDAQVVEDLTYIASDNGKYVFTAIDKAGNQGTAEIEITKIDRVNPEIRVSDKPAGYHKEFNVEITASDDKSDVTVTVSKDGGNEVSVAGTTYTVNANGTYVFTATDKAGNINVFELVVDNIDREKPVIATNYSKAWAKEVVITLNVTDNKSAVENITITVDDEPCTEGTFVATENKLYSVVATDEAGNKAEVSVDITNIDIDAPSVELSDAPAEWTNKFTFSINATDDKSGIGEIKVNGKTVDGTLYEVTENGTYTVVVTDNLGNETEKSIIVDKFDDGIPEILVSDAPAEWKKEHTLAVIVSDDLSGVKEVTVNGVKLEGQDYIVSKNGEYKFVVIDNAGNKAETTRVVDKIDEKAPVFDGEIAVTEKGLNKITVSLPKATDDSNETVTCELFLDGEKLDGYAGEESYTFADLTIATVYKVKLVATDIVGRETVIELETSTAGLGKVEVNVDLSALKVSSETLRMNIVMDGKEIPVDKDGKAVIENLAEGTYSLTFKAAGFFPVAKAEIVVKNDETTTVNFLNTEIVAGDTTGDGKINIYDLNAVASAFAESYNSETGLIYDFNRDGKVDVKDISILVANYNKVFAK